jgi:ArsR family metal-binding transcriptional regulator
VHAAPLTEGTKVRLDRTFHDLSDHSAQPDESQIREILIAMGKTSQEHELNCGTCGYPSCRDKAVAVAQGKANIHMCLPYFRERAESMSNLVIENTQTRSWSWMKTTASASLTRRPAGFSRCSWQSPSASQ